MSAQQTASQVSLNSLSRALDRRNRSLTHCLCLLLRSVGLSFGGLEVADC
eukprot:m.397237 g.397237  ORF g.397237 m.397237 type:complete len:50 (+) comp56418_c0_seq2:72-221(+)